MNRSHQLARRNRSRLRLSLSECPPSTQARMARRAGRAPRRKKGSHPRVARRPQSRHRKRRIQQKVEGQSYQGLWVYGLGRASLMEQVAQQASNQHWKVNQLWEHNQQFRRAPPSVFWSMVLKCRLIGTLNTESNSYQLFQVTPSILYTMLTFFRKKILWDCSSHIQVPHTKMWESICLERMLLRFPLKCRALNLRDSSLILLRKSWNT